MGTRGRKHFCIIFGSDVVTLAEVLKRHAAVGKSAQHHVHEALSRLRLFNISNQPLLTRCSQRLPSQRRETVFYFPLSFIFACVCVIGPNFLLQFSFLSAQPAAGTDSSSVSRPDGGESVGSGPCHELQRYATFIHSFMSADTSPVLLNHLATIQQFTLAAMLS